MRLPKVLAVAVGSVFLAGGGSALALGSSRSAVDPAVAAASVAAGGGRIAGVAADASWSRSAPGSGPASAGGAASSSSTRPSPISGPVPGIPSGLSVPAGGVPVSGGLDPAGPSSVPTTPGWGPTVSLPTPTAGSLPSVPAMSNAVSPDAVVMLSSPLTPGQLTALSKLGGVSRIETVDTGTVTLDGGPVVAFGVDPGSFRDFTPPASAASNALWQYLPGGALVSPYAMADARALKLGSEQTIVPASSAPDSSAKGWLGAFASIGLPGVDLLVDHNYSGELGLTPDSGVVVAAPGLAGTTLQQELHSALPDGAVELLHPDQLPANLPGNSLSSATRQKILAAALSRVGRPYVWGSAGPSSFDCSGLVQWSYRQAGILMPRVAAEQFLTGDHVPLADAQPGDLLFWTYDPADPGYVDHVAIYLGNDMMVVAPHTGTDVQVDPVPTADFAGAVEVILSS